MITIGTLQINISQLLTFTGLNLIYVILGVIKDVTRVKGSKKQSSISATITYGFYVFIITKIVSVPLEIAITGTMISNLIGDYLGRSIIEKFLPRGTVCYRFTICKDKEGVNQINSYLEKENLGYKWENAYSLHKEYLSYQIYPNNKQEDKLVESLLILYKIDKYNRTETKSTINFKEKEE